MGSGKEYHYDSVGRKELVVGIRLDQVALRRHEFKTKENRSGAADEKEKRDRSQIEQRDALVVGGEQPRPYAVADVDVMLRGRDWPLTVHPPALVFDSDSSDLM